MFVGINIAYLLFLGEFFNPLEFINETLEDKTFIATFLLMLYFFPESKKPKEEKEKEEEEIKEFEKLDYVGKFKLFLHSSAIFAIGFIAIFKITDFIC